MFKDKWEKTQDHHSLDTKTIDTIVYTIMGDDVAYKYSIISGGCANINIKVGANDKNTPVIVRIYIRDPAAAQKEKLLSDNYSHLVSMPKVYKLETIKGYTVAKIQYISGITLRDYLLHTDDPDIQSIMHQVGTSLGQISNIKFRECGFFDENLNISGSIGKQDNIDFIQESLNIDIVKSTLGQKLCTGIQNYLDKHIKSFPNTDEANLVHGDFDPANILVNEIDGKIKVSGILDWEFALSGPTMFDVANMLRYAHKMPKAYTNFFLCGLESSGYKIPSNWPTLINLFNIMSLLDCAKRCDPGKRPKQLKDIQELLTNIVAN